MHKELKKWVIDVVSPRKAGVVTEPGSETSGVFDLGGKAVTGSSTTWESLESVLSSDNDPVAELIKAGAMIQESRIRSNDLEIGAGTLEKFKEDFGMILAQIHTPINFDVTNLSLAEQPEPGSETSGVSGDNGEAVTGSSTTWEPELIGRQSEPRSSRWSESEAGLLAGYIKTEEVIFSPRISNSTKGTFAKVPFVGKNYWKLSILLLGLLSFTIYGFESKDEILQNSELAFHNLKEAQANLEEFDFNKASENFKNSHSYFSKADRNLSLVGAGILGYIPGLNELKSVRKIIKAGQLLTDSGQAMSKALILLSETGSVLNPNEINPIKPLKIVRQFKDALELSNKNFSRAKALLADIDDAVIPEDKRKDLIDFKEKLPIIEELLSDAYRYTDFLEGVIGVDEHKKYLILFNNYSELRPTGGFPGTYGVISFSNGEMENLFVDDIYNLDGQLKRKIIPPKQLQHITSTWGMRDAAWFVDFPTSARKVMSFFTEEAGYEIDGVIALNPDVISHLLKTIGPIEMPEYGLTLTADNFLVNIQEEVEYGDNRTQPKTIVMDFTPRLLEKLYSASSEQWVEIFKELMKNLEEKDIVFYFEDRDLENFAIEENFGGEIKQTDGDYLTVNFSNIKGSKTDIVTESFINIDARQNGGEVTHKITITRNHKGGDSEYEFYNRQNPAYVRVLIPKESELISVSGSNLPQHNSLVDYQNSDFEKDKELVKYESGFYFDKNSGVDRFEESGKSGVGFWMVTDFSMTKTVVLEYSTSVSESFYFQKQPGLDWKNFKFKLNGTTLADKELKEDLKLSF